MPEGDTVWLAAQRLKVALAGKRLSRSDFRVPALATTDLRGREVVDVVPRGKHLLTRFEGGMTLHTHFRMEGSFRIYRTGRSWHGPTDQIRLILANSDWTVVGYRIPVIELLPTDREADVVGHLGPDVLAPDWNPEQAVTNLRRAPTAEIGNALLDQRNLAGLGNLYRAEALFLRGISPWTRVGDIVDLPALVDLAARLVQANRHHVSQSTTGDTRRPNAHYVFERQGLACRRCGTLIRSARQGAPPADRITYWCPHCQPGPAPTGNTLRPRPFAGPAAAARQRSANNARRTRRPRH